MVYEIKQPDENPGEGVNLGTVRNESYDIVSALEIIGFPLSGTKATFTYDYMGVIRRITLSGRYVGSTPQALFDLFITPVDILQNGNQNFVVFHSDLVGNSATGSYTTGDYNVKIERFTWNIKEGEDGTYVDYTLLLVETSTT